MHVSLYLYLCRYEGILSTVLKHLSWSNELPAALLEHVITVRTMGNTGTLPAQTSRFRAAPGSGAETLDLLMCAASVGSVSTVQALIDCGAPGPGTCQCVRKLAVRRKSSLGCSAAMTMTESSHGDSLCLTGEDIILHGQHRCAEVSCRCLAGIVKGKWRILISASR